MNLRSCARWGMALLLAVTGLLLGAYLLRGLLLYPHLKTAAIAACRSQLDLHLQVGTIGGSLFSSLEMTDVRVRTIEPAETPLEATFAGIRLTYRLGDLFQGIEPFLGGMTIELRRPRIRIDLTRPVSDTPSDDAQAAQETPGGWPALLPRVVVTDGQLELTGDGYGSRFDDIVISPRAPSGSEAAAFQIEVGDWRWHLPPLRDGRVRAGVRVGVEPSGRLVVEGLALNGTVAVAKGSVDLSRLPRSVSFEARLPPELGQLAVNGCHDDDALGLHVDGEAVDLALVEQILEVPPQDLKGQVAILADILLPYDQPERLRGEIEIRAGSGRWRTLAWENGLLLARAADGLLSASQTEWQGEGNTCRIRDLSLPTAAIFNGQIDRLLGGLNAVFDFSLQNIPAITALWGGDIHRAIAAGPPHDMVLRGRVRDGVLLVEEGHLASGASVVRLERLQVDLAELTGRTARVNLEADAAFDVPDLAGLSALLPLPRLAGRLQGGLVFNGSMQAPRGTLTLAGGDLHLAGIRLGDLDLACRSDGEWLRAETLVLRNGDDRLDLSGRIHLASGRLEETRWTAQIRDVGVYANPLLPAGWPAQGALDLESTVTGTLAQPDARAAFTLSRPSLGDLAAIQAAGRVAASPRQVAIQRVDIKTAQGDLMLAGRLAFDPEDTLLTADLSDLSLQKDGATMRLAAPARVIWQRPNRWRVTPLVLEGAAGRLSIRGNFGGKDPADLQIDLAGVQSEPWLADVGGPVRGFEGLDARLGLAGTPGAPRLEMTGRLGLLRLRDWPQALQGRFDIALDEVGIVLRDWTWTDGASQQVTAVGRVPLVYDGGWRFLEDPLQLKADLQMGDLALLRGIAPDFPVASGTGQARLDLAGTLASPAGTLRCAFRDLLLAPSFEGQPPGPFEGQAVLRLHGQGVELDSLRIDSSLLTLQAGGHWRIADDSVPWSAMTDRLPAGTVAASAELDVPDLGWLTAVLPGIQRITGRLKGTLHVEGPWQAPAVTADLALRDGSLRPEGDAPPLQALHADLQAEAGRVAVRSFRGAIGGAPFQVKGDLRLAADGGWVTDLHLTGANLLLYRTQDIRVRADTALHLRGPVEKMVLQGEVGLTNSRMTRNVDFFGFLKKAPPSAGAPREVLFSLPDPPLKDMIFDVDITSRAPFELRNNVIKGGLRPELHLGGTGELPLLTGEVYVDPSRMRLPAGIMTIQSGVIRFLPSRANRPEMDLLGEGKMFDYDITALVEGPVDEPRVTLSSSPPLPGNELMLMLLTGQPPATERRATETGIPMNLAVYIGQDLVTQWFEGDDKESWASILDRFDVTRGRRLTRSGEETLEAQFRIGADFFRDGDSVYITGEKDVFDFYNAGLKFVFRFR